MRRTRSRQRAAHLVLGLLLVASVYVPAESGFARAVIEWFLAPATGIAGIALWQWPRLRGRLRRSGHRQGTPAQVGVGDNVA